MDFHELPESLQRKLCSGQNYVLEPHEREAFRAYMDVHLMGYPRRVSMKGLDVKKYPMTYKGPPLHFNCRSSLGFPSFFARAVESVANRLRRDLCEATWELLDQSTEPRLPQGERNTKIDWDQLEAALGAHVVRRIRETP